MSSHFPFSISKTEGERWRDHSNLAMGLWEIGHFLRRLRAHVRMGDLSRAPLRLLRFEINANRVQCNWVARPPDPWDADLRPEIGRRNVSVQALRDAIEVRRLLFDLLPDADQADLRIYREFPNTPRELIVSGRVYRNQESRRDVRSVAMQAKLLGLRFALENGVLCGTIADEPWEVSA